MLIAMLLACSSEGPPATPKACRSFDEPPTCALIGMVDGQPVEGQASLVAGIQGGMHVDVGIDLEMVGSVVRFTASLTDEDGEQYAHDDAVDLVTDVDETCMASPYGVRALFRSIPTACTMDGVPVTIHVEAERSDGQIASCSTDVELVLNQNSDWLCEDWE